jgi:hypothetical protein
VAHSNEPFDSTQASAVPRLASEANPVDDVPTVRIKGKTTVTRIALEDFGAIFSQDADGERRRTIWGIINAIKMQNAVEGSGIEVRRTPSIPTEPELCTSENEPP